MKKALISFLQTYADKENLHIAWFGGEPTLMIDTIEYVSAQLDSAGFKLTCSLVTNGYLFNDNFVRRITKYNLF